MARFFTSVIPPLPFNPATRRVSSGNPAAGTRRISMPRCVPTRTTSRSLPRESHSWAMAMAGKTWPPVPPPAMSSFTEGPSPFRALLPDVEQNAGSQQHHQQTGPAVTDERQRDAFCRHHAQHHGEVDERLAEHQGGDARREQASEIVRRGECGAQTTPAVDGEESQHQERAKEA